ncbi:dermatopontin-like protein [Pseudoalteromonas aurantia]|uniref:Secreted protein n=1 Tax=Pseudoalteromonas aurantia 208 TaxID=1314867 RepID=A0ABR9EGE9_9GAMM|nr:dermatopontin-like protein [Pseudoalteromonas aurantia]MBE0370075.1 hypothetical protein [Pseudoalteromonas aurantia 208]
MKVQLLKSALALGLASLFSTSAMADNNEYMEYKLDSKVYRIPASQSENIETIIELIESGNSVDEYNVSERLVLEFEKEEATIYVGGALKVHSTLTSGYVNDFDQAFSYTCPSNMFIKSISSFHDNRTEDRRFNIVCAKYKAGNDRMYRKTTKWSGYVNSYDTAFNYSCPNGGFLAGITSRHNNGTEDRQFSFSCANMATSRSGASLTPESCNVTPLSSYDQAWNLGSNGALIGYASQHHNHYEDRRTQVSYCNSVSDW